MQIAILYLSTTFIFLAIDALMLRFFMRPLFEGYIGDWLLTDVRIGPAVAFYMFYVAGLLWFVSLPALKENAPIMALLAGAFLGALAYGTYEFTNLATLKNWSINMVMVDVTWGAILTGFSAWAGVMITRAFA